MFQPLEIVVSVMLGRLLLATIAGWLIYSLVTRNAPFGSCQTAREFSTQLLGSVLGAIAFAWLFAPLHGVALNDYTMQLAIRASGIVVCTMPVILVWLCLRLMLRRQR